MPVDFMSDKIYNVDYMAWKEELLQMKVFNSQDIQKIYLDKWMEKLKSLDDSVCRDYYNPKIKMLMLKEKTEAPENFQIPIEYKSNSMFIHFRVSRLIQSIEQSNSSSDSAIDVRIEEFTNVNRRINWTATADKVKIKTQPIIIVPLTVGEFYQWLVVDGNHRITYAIENKKKSVKAFLLDSNALVEANMFNSGFDKFLYIFQNEMIALASYIHRDGYSDEEAFKLGFLCSGKVQ